MGNISVTPVLSRSTYFPGNLVEGRIVVNCSSSFEFYALRVAIAGEVVQGWTTGDGLGKRHHREVHPVTRITLTLDGRHENDTTSPAKTLPEGKHELPFAVMLPPDALPTVRVGEDSLHVTVQWYAQGMAEVRRGFDRSGTFPFQVLSLVPVSIWSRPSRVQQDINARLSCCCCFHYGSVGGRVDVSKSVVALDRDALQWAADINNTAGEKPVNAVTAKLIVKAVARCGRKHAPTQYVAEVKVDCNIASGRIETVTGRLPLNKFAPPSLKSSMVDVDYVVRLEFDIPFADDPTFDIPITVFHTVDERDIFANVIQQSYGHVNALPPQLLDVWTGFEKPNLYGSSPAVYQQGSIYTSSGPAMGQPLYGGQLPQQPAPPPSQSVAFSELGYPSDFFAGSQVAAPL